MRKILLAVVAAVAGLLAGLPSIGGAAAATSIVDVPVSFTVVNRNTSNVPCATDGRTYTVRGHLTGPASALAAGATPAGTLYLHGLEVGEWFWRLPVVGAGYSRDMARLGHVSVTIDRLGYNASGRPAGMKSCVGGQADVAHQIVQQLRHGTYAGTRHPAFAKVGLAGHSLGGAIGEIEASSYGDVAAVATLAYADLAPTPAVAAESLVFGPKCLAGAGYAYLTSSVADYRKNFLAHTPAAWLTQATSLRDLNPCGDMISIVPALALDAIQVGRIKAPVLLVCGDQDLVFDASRVALQAHLFTGSPSVTSRTISGATHGLTLEPTETTLVATMNGWLGRYGL